MIDGRHIQVAKEKLRWVLAPLLLLHLVLLSLQIEGSSGAMLFKTWLLYLQSPILTLSDATFGKMGRLWRNYVWLVDARDENERLREENGRLARRNRVSDEIRRENERLRRLLDMNAKTELHVLGAHVTARAPEYLSGVIYLDRGSSDGLRPDAPVFVGDGIVGRVTLVTEHYSQVQLLTNPEAAIGVMLERSRTPGVLTGTGEPLLRLGYISNTQPVSVGEKVFSSGLDGIFPKGMIIGTVVTADKGPDVFRNIKVRPLVDMLRLEDVAVLVTESSAEKTPAQHKNAEITQEK